MNIDDRSLIINASNFRQQFFDDYVVCRSFLAKRRARNAELYPNLACFAFDLISAELMIFGRFEKQLLDTTFAGLSDLASLFSRTAAIDIGANIGNHSVYFGERFKQVYAIEANPRVFMLLNANVATCTRGNVEAIQAALGETKERVTFSEHRNEIGRSGIIHAENKYSGVLDSQAGRKFDLMSEVGDDLFASRRSTAISLIKIDVEGFEPSVIRGLSNTIRQYKPIILIEQNAHEVENGTTEAVELLRRYGYTRFHHSRSLIAIKSRRLRLIYKLFFGDKWGLQEIRTLDNEHYPLLVCRAENFPVVPS